MSETSATALAGDTLIFHRREFPLERCLWGAGSFAMPVLGRLV
jgi:hypothetical protein